MIELGILKVDAEAETVFYSVSDYRHDTVRLCVVKTGSIPSPGTIKEMLPFRTLAMWKSVSVGCLK